MITCAVLLLSHVRLPHPVAVGILQMSLLQLRLPLLHAQSLVIHLSLGLLLAGISDSLHRTVLVHETLQAIVPITVASQKIAHASDSPLAIIPATDGDSLQGIPLLLSVDVHPVPPLMMPPLRDPHHGLLLSSPSREDGDPDDSSVSGPVRAMVDYILQTFPESKASPSHPSSRSFDLSASAGVADVAISPGSLLAWSHALSDSFTETQQRFARRIKDGKVCHTLLPTLNRFERVSNSPTQGKELRANADVLDLLRNRVPDSRYVPLSLKEAAALERSLRSLLESHSFLTWSVVALIRSLHNRNLLPKDDQIISQLQKSFSKACGNVASGLSSSAAIVTLKRRQLLLSHVVPSVSDTQKRNLLSDPFFPNRLTLFQFVCGGCSLCRLRLVPVQASLKGFVLGDSLTSLGLFWLCGSKSSFSAFICPFFVAAVFFPSQASAW